MAYDVIVIGGGITGAGILRDLALRGLKVLLLEKGSPGGATTAASTHLIHGGLRYLLYDRPTTYATSWDAGNIVRIAGGLLRRLPVLWPIYRGQSHGIETVETLLEAYDPFQRMKGGLPHLRLSARAVRELVPGLRHGRLQGGLSFDEWWVDSVELVRRNLESARLGGSESRPRTEVTGLLRSGDRVAGVKARTEGGPSATYEAEVVVNAAGPWADRVAGLDGREIPLRLRKGTHLVYDRPLVPMGLFLEAADRDRHIFVVPYPGGTLVGPTDLPYAGDPDEAEAGADEALYLLDSVRKWIPDFPKGYARTVTGARPILGQAGAEKLLSREYEVFDHGDGLVSVAGGKLSDFRLMAKDAADAVCRRLGRGEPCATHRLTLEGKPVEDIPEFPRPSKKLRRFMRRHPRLRELHALSHLAVSLLTHMLRRIFLGARAADAAAFRRHYGLP